MMCQFSFYKIVKLRHIHDVQQEFILTMINVLMLKKICCLAVLVGKGGSVAASLSMVVEQYEPYEWDNMNSVFVCTAGADNLNRGSGTVMSFEVVVPANAKSGDKYPVKNCSIVIK